MKVRKILRLLGVVEKLPRNYNEDIQPVDFGTYYCETKDEYLEIMDMDFIYVLNAIKKHGIGTATNNGVLIKQIEEQIEQIDKLTLELTNEKAKNIKLKQIKEIIND
jgi:hypothetical protein|tara:strand:- start:37 stop:357 length:321 start_codon:yes stop_codon:yes gene_type:complete